MEYKIGDIVKCIVSGIEKYGIFVNIDDKYTGLIHISEMDNNFVKDVNDYVKIDENIYAIIIGIDEERKHMNLSIKHMNYTNNENDKRKVKESIKGFLPLANKLPEWINETKSQNKNE